MYVDKNLKLKRKIFLCNNIFLIKYYQFGKRIDTFTFQQ